MNEFNLGESSLFSEHFNEEQKEVIKELFNKLSLDEIDEKLLQEFTDYRTYMDYDIKIHHENGELSLFSKVNSEKSGGETQSPLASPSDKLELISPYVDDTVIVYKDRHKNVPKYFDTNTFDYEDYNKACEHLERESLIIRFILF